MVDFAFDPPTGSSYSRANTWGETVRNVARRSVEDPPSGLFGQMGIPMEPGTKLPSPTGEGEEKGGYRWVTGS